MYSDDGDFLSIIDCNLSVRTFVLRLKKRKNYDPFFHRLRFKLLPHDKPRRAPVLTLFYFEPHVDAVF